MNLRKKRTILTYVDKELYRQVLSQEPRCTTDGYTVRKFPEHPYARNDGYVATHILVMEYHIDRFLNVADEWLDTEIVHHKNRNKKDNRYKNLQLLTVREHNRLHVLENAIERGCPNYYNYDWLYQKFIVEDINITKMAELCNVTRSSMTEHLVKFELYEVQESNKEIKPYYRSKTWLYQKYIVQDWNQDKIADYCNCSKTVIWTWLARFNIRKIGVGA